MASSTTVSNIKYIGDAGSDGTVMGRSATDLIGFYGATPVARRAAAAQATTAVAVSASFGATQLAALQEVMNTLAALGLWKGAA